MGAYSPTGPFADGGAPGLAAAFFNNIEGWVAKVDNTTGVTVSGSSGTATLYQFLQGTLKAALVYWAGYKTTSPQNLVLPVAFTANGMFWITESQSGVILFKSGGSTVTCSVQNIMSSTGGTQNAANPTGWTNGNTRGGFDTLNLSFTSGTAASGSLLVIGI